MAEVVGAIASVDEARDGARCSTRSRRERRRRLRRRAASMPDGEGAGLELVRELSREPDAPLFVLATAFKEHALRGRSSSAWPTICIKHSPRSASRLASSDFTPGALTPRASLSTLRSLRIVARRGRGLVFLDPSEVWAFEGPPTGLRRCTLSHGTLRRRPVALRRSRLHSVARSRASIATGS